MSRLSQIYALSVLSLLALASPALASSTAHEGAERHINWWSIDPHVIPMGWLVVDFAVFIGI